ncbi:MAG: acetylglutamate kinase [Clostridiales Family XIII bacterium]|jgi:acetylglutamate kinase|nr:acetylglutamate kinase [Clostridiales Family XIII bacterium]
MLDIEGAKERAGILLEALPYIQKYEGQTIVVKYGGAAMTDERLKHSVMRDIVLLTHVGMRVVLVHGGGPEISTTLDRLGKESVFVDGLRYTDEETADVVAMVLAGKVNKSLVSLIHKAHGRAIGICGVDGGMLRVVRMPGRDLGYVGKIVAVDVAAVDLALDSGFIPIIATVGVDDAGQVYNINADTAAAEIAAALRAEKLIALTDVRGVLRDREDDASLIEEIHLRELPGLIESGVVSGGMIPKIDCCREAIRKGLKEAVIIDGRIEHSILLELFSDRGIGTLLHR